MRITGISDPRSPISSADGNLNILTLLLRMYRTSRMQSNARANGRYNNSGWPYIDGVTLLKVVPSFRFIRVVMNFVSRLK